MNGSGSVAPIPSPPRFFYDLSSPYAWISAERVDAQLPGVVWVPVALGAIFKARGRMSWALTPEREAGMRDVEQRARVRGLPEVRWPEPWPGNGLRAMRVATYADAQGAGPAFALAAFRVHFAEGRTVADDDALADAAARAGLDPQAALAAAGTQPVKDALRAHTDDALARGVIGVPSFAAGDEVVWGDDALDALGARYRSAAGQAIR